MKNVLLTHSYFLQFDAKQKKGGRPYAPLGTLQAAAVLREQGFDVAVFDTMFAREAAALQPVLAQRRPQYVVVYDDGFNYLTKMCLTNMREAAFAMVKMAKQAGSVTIVCSSDSTDRFADYLQAGADYVLLGEGEQTLVELLHCLEKGESVDRVPGLAFTPGNAAVKTSPRSVLKDLDALPLPAWDLIDLQPYRQSWLKNAGYFSMNVGTTRGCPFKCNWCAKPIYGNRYHARSPQHVVNELLLLQKTYAPNHIWFCDDIFGLKPGWVQEFARLMQEADLRLRFKIQSRADLLVQENYVTSLAAAGCDEVWMGAESGSQKILDAMDKGIRVEQIESATSLLKAQGIKPSFFIQFGYPGETADDIALTIALINRLLPHDIGISVSYPLPGTKFYENVKEQLQQKTNWSHSDDLALLFRNEYPPAFYKQLHRYVHKSYRKHLALATAANLWRKPFGGEGNLRRALSALYYAPASFVAKQKLRQRQHPA